MAARWTTVLPGRTPRPLGCIRVPLADSERASHPADESLVPRDSPTLHPVTRRACDARVSVRPPLADRQGTRPSSQTREFGQEPPGWGAPPIRRGARRGLVVAVLVLFTLLVVSALLVIRYAPLLDDVPQLRRSAQRFSAAVRAPKPEDLSEATLTASGDLGQLDADLEPIKGIAGRPARWGDAWPADRRHPGPRRRRAARRPASDSLVKAGDLGLDLAGHVADLEEDDAADPTEPLLPKLMEFVATSTGRGRHVERARPGCERPSCHDHLTYAIPPTSGCPRPPDRQLRRDRSFARRISRDR